VVHSAAVSSFCPVENLLLSGFLMCCMMHVFNCLTDTYCSMQQLLLRHILAPAYPLLPLCACRASSRLARW
jgi:hypothetical protein